MSKHESNITSAPRSETGSNRSDNYYLMIGGGNRRKLQIRESRLTDRIQAEEYEIYLTDLKENEL
jgi:hypothetical protein